MPLPQLRLPSRHPVVAHRELDLGEQAADVQRRRGLFTMNGGVPFAIPVDSLKDRTTFRGRKLWAELADGSVGRPDVQLPRAYQAPVQRRVLEFLRDRVDSRIPYLYYMATLGHDLHVSTWGDLSARHWHAGWANPLHPDRLEAPFDPTFDTLRRTHFVTHDCDLGARCPARIWPTWAAALRALIAQRGFVENLGLLSVAKVTDAFVSEEIDELVSAVGSEYADFDSHEVGTNATAEDNNQTALIATSGIARAAGTPTDSDPVYQSVGTITADTTETWQEWGLFNNTTGPALMDRSLTGGQSVNASDQVQYTYQLTKQPEA